jgi:thioredoxin 1
MEQTPINTEVAKDLNITIEEIDAIKNQHFIREFGLKVTPTIIVQRDGEVVERLEGVAHAEHLKEAIRKYL